ncbi:hypothetical protein Ahy_A02g006377 [Arachis hypogaea]|uniref:FAR1 domain-containing protein n=1 Tax=Arachis hypogaea TaxID=3818 RepID=A0A445E9H7_ARAHY|nr:hypothetical protein Ahy_A02g006377 [Arachis hypogaea]
MLDTVAKRWKKNANGGQRRRKSAWGRGGGSGSDEETRRNRRQQRRKKKLVEGERKKLVLVEGSVNEARENCQLNQGEVDYEFKSNEVPEPLSVVDDQFVPKVGMTFTTLEDAEKFYRNYAKAADFSTRVRSTNRKGNEIKNQLITCSREGKWKSKISPTEKTNPTAGLNCPARIYIHTLKDVSAWIISKVVLDHSNS